jgi:hypothetical protein
VLNPAFFLAYHVPSEWFSEKLKHLFWWSLRVDPPDPTLDTDMGRLDGFYRGHPLRFHEDLVGAPLHVAVVAGAILFGILATVLFSGAARRSARAWLGIVLCPLVGWVVFAWIVRNNPWVARYHAAWIPSAVLSTATVCRIARERPRVRRIVAFVAGAAACASFVLAVGAMLRNEMRPVSVDMFRRGHDRVHEYYHYQPDLEAEHRMLLEHALGRDCRRIAASFGYDDLEYPLLWRAHVAGVAVEPAASGLDNACLLYAPHGLPDGVPGAWDSTPIDGLPIYQRAGDTGR